MEKVHDLLRAGNEINKFIDNIAGIREHQNEDRGRLLMSYVHVALEHHRSLLLLVEKRLYGSAFALLRVLYEAVLRGLWFGHCANDSEINSFLSEKNFKFLPAKKMAEAVDTALKLGTYFQNIHTSPFFNAMSGYTHTGTHQISRRLKPDIVTWNYEEGEILEVLHNSNCIVLMNMRSYIQYFEYAEDEAPFLNLYGRYMNNARKVFPEPSS